MNLWKVILSVEETPFSNVIRRISWPCKEQFLFVLSLASILPKFFSLVRPSDHEVLSEVGGKFLNLDLDNIRVFVASISKSSEIDSIYRHFTISLCHPYRSCNTIIYWNSLQFFSVEFNFYIILRVAIYWSYWVWSFTLQTSFLLHIFSSIVYLNDDLASLISCLRQTVFQSDTLILSRWVVPHYIFQYFKSISSDDLLWNVYNIGHNR